MAKLSKLEIRALRDAAERPGGWGLFNRKTTDRLATVGYFEKAKHSTYGMQWCITEAGRAALQEAAR